MLWRRIPGAVLILHADAGDDDPVEVNGSGADLWDLLAVPTTATAACAVLSPDEFDRGVVKADIERVLRELEERGFVERAH